MLALSFSPYLYVLIIRVIILIKKFASHVTKKTHSKLLNPTEDGKSVTENSSTQKKEKPTVSEPKKIFEEDSEDEPSPTTKIFEDLVKKNTKINASKRIIETDDSEDILKSSEINTILQSINDNIKPLDTNKKYIEIDQAPIKVYKSKLSKEQSNFLNFAKNRKKGSESEVNSEDQSDSSSKKMFKKQSITQTNTEKVSKDDMIRNLALPNAIVTTKKKKSKPIPKPIKTTIITPKKKIEKESTNDESDEGIFEEINKFNKNSKLNSPRTSPTKSKVQLKANMKEDSKKKVKEHKSLHKETKLNSDDDFEDNPLKNHKKKVKKESSSPEQESETSDSSSDSDSKKIKKNQKKKEKRRSINLAKPEFRPNERVPSQVNSISRTNKIELKSSKFRSMSAQYREIVQTSKETADEEARKNLGIFFGYYFIITGLQIEETGSESDDSTQKIADRLKDTILTNGGKVVATYTDVPEKIRKKIEMIHQ